MKNNKKRLSVRDMILFSLLAVLMFCSKVVMAPLANIHLVGTLTMVYTVSFRKKALIPIYLYVLMEGLFYGFTLFWLPYLYVWTVLWGVTVLLPENISHKVAVVVYPVICSLHGFLFGVLWAPAQALLLGFTFKQTVAWVAAGFYFDVVHGISNFVTGFLILPLSSLLKRLNKKTNIRER